MNYKEAFIHIVEQHGLEVLDKNFLVRSFLFDRVGCSITDKQLIDAYYLLNKETIINRSINGLTLAESKEYIKTIILKSSKEYSPAQYIKSIEPLLLILFPNEYVLFDETKMIKKSNSVIRVVRQKKEAPISPIMPLINNNPKPKKKREKLLDLSIKITCYRLKIMYGNQSSIRLINSDGIDVTNNTQFTNNNGSFRLVLQAKHEKYTLMIPNKKYRNINVVFHGENLFVGDYLPPKIKAENISITSNGRTFVYAEANTLNIKQTIEDVYIDGAVKTLNVDTTISSVNCSLDGNVIETCNINELSGNIDLCFPGYSVWPKINHFLKKTRSVNGTYYIGSRKVNLLMNTMTGKIIVR